MAEPNLIPTQNQSQNLGQTFHNAAIVNNPAWAQLLGLCPLLAVSNSVANALGLSVATLFVIVGSNTTISAIRQFIPDIARLPCFVLVIATFTTVTTLLLEAYAFGLYEKIALFVQIIVTNCMILGRVEQFASRQSVPRAIVDAIGTAVGFALVLILLGALREVLGQGTLFADVNLLLGTTTDFTIEITPKAVFPLAISPPGAFLVAGLAYAFIRWIGSTIKLQKV